MLDLETEIEALWRSLFKWIAIAMLFTLGLGVALGFTIINNLLILP